MPKAGEQVLAASAAWIGTPFHWEAALRGVGCDCKGMIAGAARDAGRPEAASVEAQFRGYAASVPEGELLAGMARLFDPVAGEWLPGDVLLIRVGKKVQHMALYAGEGRMRHTMGRGPSRVVDVPMGGFWRSAVHSAWRWREAG